MNNTQRQKGGIGVIVGIVIFLLFMVGAVYWVVAHKNTSSAVPPLSTTNQPQIKETNYAPGVPANQTTAILVQHSDSTEEKFILSNTMVENYIQHLPEGDKVVSQTPLH